MTAEAAAWTDGMLVSWLFRGSQPGGEDEAVALAEDGTAWLWVAVSADPERADVVGTFRARVSEDARARAKELASELPTVDSASDGHRGVVLVRAGGVARDVPMRGAGGTAAAIVRLGRDLAAAAFAQPFAAVRFEARFVPLPDLSAIPGIDPEQLPPQLRAAARGTIGGAAGLVAVTVSALGTESAGLIVAADRWQAHWRSGERPLEWTELPRPTVGLTGGDAFYDGLRTPARVPPGSAAALSLSATVPDPSADAVVVRAAGKVELLGPWEPLGVPTSAYEARTRPAPVAPPTA